MPNAMSTERLVRRIARAERGGAAISPAGDLWGRYDAADELTRMLAAHSAVPDVDARTIAVARVAL